MERCSSTDCQNQYPSHKFGAIRAASEGCFLQKNGDARCPEHVPAWVASWRDGLRVK